MIDRFLSAEDACRAWKTIQKLSRHDISRWVLTGGFAVEIHCLRAGGPACIRPLNDIDFVAEAFDCIPKTLSGDFLFRHVHPFDPPGRTILQVVDAETALRVDLFRANEAIIARSVSVDLLCGTPRLVSLEDVLARAARLLLDLAGGVAVPAKHAHDYLRLAKLVQPADVETAWQDHRKSGHPATFREADSRVRYLFDAHRDALIVPDYSQDVSQTCPRCVATGAFPLADPRRILSLLGYC